MSAFRASWWFGSLALALLCACEKVVVATVEVDEVAVVPPSFTVVAGDRQTASAIVMANGGAELSGLAVSWSVDDPEIATVTSDGVVVGLRAGNTVVRATAEGVSGVAEVLVLRGPTIRVSSSDVEVDASALDTTVVLEVQVENAGNGTLSELDVDVVDRSGNAVAWLRAQLLGATAPTLLRLVMTPRDLGPGSYEAFAVVSSPATLSGSSQVRVRLRVGGAPDPPEPEPDPGSCDVKDRTFEDDVEISRDARCTFTNVRVRGRLRLREDARLVARELTVEGDVEADGAGRLTLSDSRVFGNLEFRNGWFATIRGTSVDGRLQLESNRGELILSDNIVRERIELEDNREGPFTLLGNTARSLECKGNEPRPTGAGNVTSDKNKGQCSGL